MFSHTQQHPWVASPEDPKGQLPCMLASEEWVLQGKLRKIAHGSFSKFCWCSRGTFPYHCKMVPFQWILWYSPLSWAAFLGPLPVSFFPVSSVVEQLSCWTWITVILNGLPWRWTEVILSFWDCIQVLHFGLFCWLWWLLHFFEGFLPTVVDIMVIWVKFTHSSPLSFADS